MVQIIIQPAKSRPIPLAKGLPITFDFSEKAFGQATVGDVKRALAGKFRDFDYHRQELRLDETGKGLADNAKLADILATPSSQEGQKAGVVATAVAIANSTPETVTLYIKDLGRQVSWQTVFFVEYAGPLLIHPLFFNFSKIIYGQEFEKSHVQKLAYSMVMIHFCKRELETMVVHRFSHSTMPFRNIFKNSAHYHLMSGLWLAWAVYSPKFSEKALEGTWQDDPRILLGCMAVWFIAQLGNLHAHLVLRWLRPEGSTKRAIPRGGMFALVSCANYFWEIVAWSAIAVMTNSFAAWAFLIVSTYQMTEWALKKHRLYKKEFGAEYPKGRKAIFPFVI